MGERITSPYGSWASPITPTMLLKGTVHMRNQMTRWDGADLYWSELRPSEATLAALDQTFKPGVTQGERYAAPMMARLGL